MQLTYFNQKGNLLPILVQEHGIGRGRRVVTRAVDLFASDGGGSPYVTECPAPHFITTRLRSLFLENLEYSTFDLRQSDAVRRQGLVRGDDRAHPLRADAARADRGLHRLCRADAAAAGLGAPGADRRAAGRHRGGARQAREAEARPRCRWPGSGCRTGAGRGRPTPASSSGGTGGSTADTIPTGRALSAEVAAAGGRMLVYINPYLCRQPGHDALYQQALAAGYLVRAGRRHPVSHPQHQLRRRGDRPQQPRRAGVDQGGDQGRADRRGRGLGVDERLRRGADVRHAASTTAAIR